MAREPKDIAKYLSDMNKDRGIADTARLLNTSKNTALSTVRLQAGSFSKPGGFTQVRANTRERRITCSFGAVNTAKVFFHGLGFAPSGYTVLSKNQVANIYNDLPLPATSRVLVLKCDTANAVFDILVR